MNEWSIPVRTRRCPQCRAPVGYTEAGEMRFDSSQYHRDAAKKLSEISALRGRCERAERVAVGDLAARAMTEWKQERPSWCPHQDCQFRCRSQDSICIGELPAPLDHGGIANTHRLCQRGAEEDGLWLHQLEWNRGDAWNLRRVIDAAFGF